MKQIKFGRLFLRNFKSFAEPIEFDFSKQDLFILGGPNGFGKTTIFDAIELCFRNEISRLFKTDNKKKDAHHLKNNTNEIAVICLELISDTETYAIYLEIPKSESKDDNRIGVNNYLFKILNQYPKKELDDGYELTQPIIDEYSIDRELSEIIDNEQLKETFTIFNYIQQEDTAHFLKNSEKERHGAINYLLGTKEERSQQEKIQLIRVFVKNKLEKIQEEIKGLQKDLQSDGLQYINNFNQFLNIAPKGSEKFSCIYNLTDPTGLPYESLNIFSTSLVRVEWLNKNIETYKKIQLDNYIDILTIERDDLILSLLYVWHIKSYDEIKKNNQYCNKITRVRNRIKLFEQKIPKFELLLNSSLRKIDVEDIFSDLGIIFTSLESRFKFFESSLQELENLEKESNSHQKMIEIIDLSRKNLLEKYNEFVGHNHIQEINCPLCGVEKGSLDILLQEYDNQSRIFNNFKDGSDIRKIEINNEVKDSLIRPYIKYMNRYIEKMGKVLVSTTTSTYLQNQIISEEMWNRVQKLRMWLSSNNILFHDAIFNKENIESQMILDSDAFLETFKYNVKHYKTLPESEYTFEQIQTSLKNLQLELTEKFSLLDIASKQEILKNDLELESEYIKFLISSKKYLENNKKQAEITELQSQFDFYNQYGEAKTGHLNKIYKIYDKQIETFEKQVVKNISIPFYIYSAKTLQTRIDGNGVFIDTAPIGRENNFLRFSYSAKSDHDAWNTMSSGQLSGVVITFMLAMNKMYPTNLKTLLIDDPVQTMDEINMVSLLQLLRYEFSDYQLIMSTHEKSTSNYFAYKYSALGKSVKPLDIKSYRFQKMGEHIN